MHFEIHITCEDPLFVEDVTISLRKIAVDLLRPDLTKLRTEYMTSHREEFDSFVKCKDAVDSYVERIKNDYEVIRVKIECPFHKELINQSLYIESHFDINQTIRLDENVFPLSRSRHKTEIMGTSRQYNKPYFHYFYDRWKPFGIVELCLFDSFVYEDLDWFDLYVNSNNPKTH